MICDTNLECLVTSDVLWLLDHGTTIYLKGFAGPGHSTTTSLCAAVPSRDWHYQIRVIDGKYISEPICTFLIFNALVFSHVVGDRLSLFFFLFFSEQDTWDQLAS